VQAEIARRRELGIFANPRVKTNCFTGKIACVHCGKNFRRYTKSRKNRDSFKIWRCSVKNKMGVSACGSRDIAEESLRTACCIALGTDDFEEELFRGEVDKIRVVADFRLEFVFLNGEKRIINLGE
ncbi:MAG: zinc ribbon domain-containing protein, partial [Oscillospiraceae bacterium]|nr:zinc ribbon domain-containing protein [Oscillospiraceae bacterium]